jgi:dihydroflavonol-4-reductase
MRALVLGGSGFIGANVVRALLASGYSVRAMRRAKSDTRSLREIQQDIELVEGDLREPDSLAQAMADCQVLLHCAGYLPYSAGNVEAQVTDGFRQMRNVIEAAKKSKIEKIVYTSACTTIAPAREKGRFANESDPYTPSPRDHVYHQVKYAMEEAAMRAAYQEAVPLVVLNPTACFGPYDTRPVTGNLFLLYKRWPFPFYPLGVVNAVDVRDVAHAHVAALEKGRVGDRYLLGHVNFSGRGLAQLACRVMKIMGPFIPAPFPLAYLVASLSESAVGGKPGRFPLVASGFVAQLRRGFPLNTNRAVQVLGMPQSPIDRAMWDHVQWMRRVKRI